MDVKVGRLIPLMPCTEYQRSYGHQECQVEQQVINDEVLLEIDVRFLPLEVASHFYYHISSSCNNQHAGYSNYQI